MRGIGEAFSGPVAPALAALVVLFVLTRVLTRRFNAGSETTACLDYGAFVALTLLIAETASFRISCWLWGAFCFVVLREYFSLIDIRWQDRFAVWIAYLSIPFMLYYAATDWYNMFIVTIPVYSFLVVPFVISLSGRKAEGAIYSVGAICFGLFLFVYCVGHLAYLSRYSVSLAGVVIVAIVLADLWLRQLSARGVAGVRLLSFGYFVTAPLCALLVWSVSGWTGVSGRHSAILGAMLPALVIAGNHTIAHIGADLGISGPSVPAGKGGIIRNVKPMLFAAPIALHYYRYFVL